MPLLVGALGCMGSNVLSGLRYAVCGMRFARPHGHSASMIRDGAGQLAQAIPSGTQARRAFACNWQLATSN